MIDVEDYHLRGAAGFATGLDYSGEGVETFHEAEWAAGCASAAETFGRAAQWREIRAGSAAPLEEHTFGFGQREDGIKRIFYRIDETRRALRLAIAGDAELDLLSLRIPVP